MAFKFIPIFTLISLTLAIEVVDYNAAPSTRGNGLTSGYQIQKDLQAPAYKQVEYEQFAPAAYDFNYQVHDEHTGDIKSQNEVRNGDAVQGRYELIDSDGFRRIVEYTADGHSGFKAIVHREPVDIKIPQPIPRDPKLSYAAPVIKDIPIQAYPVNKPTIYAVPKYSLPVRTAPQYFAAPTQSQGSVTQTAEVFRTPVHSAALQNADQAYATPLQSTPAAPVNVYYRPAFKSQAYSAPAQNIQAYSTPAYNTIAYSAPSYSQQAAAVLSNNAYTDTFAAYNQKYFTPPTVKNYYSSPTFAKFAYTSPSAVAGFTSHVNDETGYSNAASTQGGFAPIQFPQVKASTGNALQPTQSPAGVSEEPKFDVRSAAVSQQNSNSAQSDSGSSASYTVSTTPGYKH